MRGLGWVALVATVVLAGSPGPEAPRTPAARTDLVAAASLRQDGDLLFGAEDRARAETWWGAGSASGLEVDEGGRFTRPLPYVGLLALAGGRPGWRVVALQVLILLAAALLAALVLRRDLVGMAPWWVVAGLLGSSVAPAVRWPGDVAFVAAVTLTAFALVRRRERPATGGLTEVYDQAWREPAWRTAIYWLVVGVLLGAVVAQRPVTLVLVPAAIALAPILHRWVAGPSLLLGLAAVVVLCWWTTGPIVDLGAGFDLAGFGADLETWKWRGVDLSIGSEVGILVGFLPLVVVPFLGSGGSGRRWVWAGTLLGVAVLVAMSPWSWADATVPMGLVGFVPLYAALLLVPRRPPPPAALLLVGVLGLIALLPMWWTGPEVATVRGWVTRVLPPATTIDRGWTPVTPDVRAWLGSPGARPTVEGASTSAVALAAARPVRQVRLLFAPGGPTELQLEGASIVQTLFTPDGSTGVVVSSPEASRHHLVGWHDAPVAVYLWRLSLGPPAGAQAVRVEVE